MGARGRQISNFSRIQTNLSDYDSNHDTRLMAGGSRSDTAVLAQPVRQGVVLSQTVHPIRNTGSNGTNRTQETLATSISSDRAVLAQPVCSSVVLSQIVHAVGETDNASVINEQDNRNTTTTELEQAMATSFHSDGGGSGAASLSAYGSTAGSPCSWRGRQSFC